MPLLLAASLALAGCEAGVNQRLLETPTAYPVRSPVAASPGAAPSAADPALRAAEAALAAGRLATAEAAFAEVLAATPTNLDAYVGRASARAASGDLVGATADLDAALGLAPARPDLFLARADVMRQRADFAAAEADLGRAIALDPANAAAFVRRAEMIRLTAQGDPARYQAALDDLGRALALAPADPAARIGRARVLADRAAFRGDATDLDRAVAELDALPPGTGGETATLLRARILAARGEVEEARRLLDAPIVRTVDDSPASDADRLAARAAVALSARDWPDAVSAAGAAIAADPAAWETYRVLAEAQLGAGDPTAALATADRLLGAWQDDGPGLVLRGLALRRLGRQAEADRALEEARLRLAASPVYRARIAQAEGDRPGALPAASPPVAVR